MQKKALILQNVYATDTEHSFWLLDLRSPWTLRRLGPWTTPVGPPLIFADEFYHAEVSTNFRKLKWTKLWSAFIIRVMGSSFYLTLFFRFHATNIMDSF